MTTITVLGGMRIARGAGFRIGSRWYGTPATVVLQDMYRVAHARFCDILWYVVFENCIGCGGALHENDVRAG